MFIKKVLIIDDDVEIVERLVRYFDMHELSLSFCLTPKEGITLLRGAAFDLLILDVMLPEIDGFEVCKRVRAFSEIPIIMLTARGELSDKVVGFELGVDDYLPKPFEPRELVARTKRLIKRHSKVLPCDVLSYSGLEINVNRRSVNIDDKPIELTAMEFDLLLLLARHPSEVIDRDKIQNELQGIETDVFSRSIDILTSRVRAKIGDTSKPFRFIKTYRGKGYIFIGEKN